jgi:hypothetical protein
MPNRVNVSPHLKLCPEAFTAAVRGGTGVGVQVFPSRAVRASFSHGRQRCGAGHLQRCAHYRGRSGDLPAPLYVCQMYALTSDWKKPTDSKGWFRLGHAIRLAYQLDLHLPRKGSLSDDERVARLQLVRNACCLADDGRIGNAPGSVSCNCVNALTKALYCFDST